MLQHFSDLNLDASELQNPFSQAFWKSPDCISITNLEGLILQINLAGLTLIGAESQKIFDHQMANFIAPEFRNVWRQYHRRVCSGEASIWECELVAAPGDLPRWVEIHGAPIVLPSGETANLSVIRDCTNRKKLESRHQQLLEELPQLIWISSAKTGQTLFVNARCIEYKGFDATKKKDGGWTHSLHPDEEKTICALWENARSTGQTFEAEYRLRAKDGSYRWFIGRAIPCHDERGEITEWLGTCTDIDDRRQAESALKLQSQITRIITDNAASSLFLMDRDGLPTFMNPAAEKVTGFKIEDLVSQTLHDSIHYCKPDGSSYPRGECPIEKALRDGEPIRNSEETFIDREGRLYPVSYSVSPLKADGVVMGSVLEFRDISEQKRIQAALEEAFQKSESAVRARDEFLSIASHELKTPLTSLKLQSQLLKRAIEKQDPSAYSKERVDLLSEQTDRQVSRLSRLIDDMLDISRIQTGRLTINGEELDLGELAEDVVQRMTVQFSAANISMPTLRTSQNLKGFWDRLRLEQVLTNLLTNAIRYGRGFPIEIAIERKGENILLSVHDQGIGIEADAQSRIFDRFERAVNANEVSGLGLGLYIAKQIVQAHGGRIWVESKVTVGSTFFIELPVKGLPNAQ